MNRELVDVRPPRARRRALRFGIPLVAAAALLIGGFGGQNANASASCLIVSNIGIVVPTSSGTLTISRDAGGSLAAIRVNGSGCGFLGTTSKMVIQPTADNVDVVLDQTNGRFEPGLGGESGGIAEIEFEIDGGPGTDTLKVIGTSGADIIAFGTNGVALNSDNDTDITKAINLEGFSADGRAGADVLTGAGNKNGTTGAFTSPLTFLGGAGNDSLTGGTSGADTADFSNAPGGVTVNLQAGTATGDGSDTLASMENVTGSAFNDAVTLKPNQINLVKLGSGNDSCKQVSIGVNNGGVEGDTCDGGAGTDTYDATGVLRNSPGLNLDFLNNIVTGSGPDFIPGIENFNGTAGEDTVKFQPGEINVANMGAGDDICYQVSVGVNNGGVEGDTCNGEAGNDTYDGTGILRNSPGINIDFLNNLITGSGPDHIPGVENANGTNGEDTVKFQPNEINVANMGGGDDICYQVSVGVNNGGVEGDTCNGGPGIDRYDGSGILRNSPGISLDFLNNLVTGSGPDHIPGVEEGVGTTGDDTFIDADDDCNLVRGLEGDDVWLAGFDRPGSESDPQRGTCGDDVDLGEGGEVEGDTLDYGNTVANSPGVLINLPAGIISGSPEDKGKNAENACGSEHADIIIGSPENNRICGRGGDDTISGGGGDDVLDGGAGNDKLVSAEGDNFTCNLGTGEAQGDEGDTVTSFETCGAGEGNDIIYGTNGDDVIYGGGGNDTIYGGNGNDTIYGEGGDDFIDGQNGSDTIYGGDGNDTLRGGANGNDTIFGDAGDDDIDGGNGDDTLDGGDGFDVIEGGTGVDSCVNGEQVTGCEH